MILDLDPVEENNLIKDDFLREFVNRNLPGIHSKNLP